MIPGTSPRGIYGVTRELQLLVGCWPVVHETCEGSLADTQAPNTLMPIAFRAQACTVVDTRHPQALKVAATF